MSILSRLRKKEDTAPAIKEGMSAAVTPVAIPAIVAEVKKGHTKGHHAWRVLVRPLVSEKAANASAHQQYMFVIASSASKGDVRRAIAEAYGVWPIAVNTAWVRGKDLRYGNATGTTKKWKKAVVTLPKDKKIQIYEGV